MAKYYFRKEDESCYQLQYHIEWMKENYIDELKLFDAKREIDTEMFFCKYYEEELIERNDFRKMFNNILSE